MTACATLTFLNAWLWVAAAAALSWPGLSAHLRHLGQSLVPAAAVYCRAMCMRSSASGSWISSPLTSTVTSCSVPVNLNGLG